MRDLVFRRDGVVPLRDERYATLWETGGAATGLACLSACFVTVDSGRASPLHHHNKTEELYLIVAGAGVMRFGECRAPIRASDCISIPAGVAHAIENPAATPLTMRVVTSPPYGEDDDFECVR